MDPVNQTTYLKFHPASVHAISNAHINIMSCGYGVRGVEVSDLHRPLESK